MEQTVQAILEMEAAGGSETLVPICQIHGITSKKTVSLILTAIRISNFIQYFNFLID
jgi:hypothetical protein